MKKMIFYFSGTGNSLKTAKELKKLINADELLFIPQALKNNSFTFDADIIGIVFPVYVWGPPQIVAEFCSKLKIANTANYIFSVATYGGFSGNPHRIIDKKLAAENLKLAASFNVRMPGNYTPLYGAPSEKKQNKLFSKAELKIKKIADYINARKTGMFEGNNLFSNYIMSSLIYNAGIKQMSKKAADFFANEKCNGCGLCARICPVNNIRLENNKPAWSLNCEQCMICLQWCPTEAVELGKLTRGRRRYRHPDCSINDILKIK